MEGSDIGSLAVVEGRELVGLITERDIRRTVAEGRDPGTTVVIDHERRARHLRSLTSMSGMRQRGSSNRVIATSPWSTTTDPCSGWSRSGISSRPWSTPSRRRYPTGTQTSFISATLTSVFSSGISTSSIESAFATNSSSRSATSSCRSASKSDSSAFSSSSAAGRFRPGPLPDCSLSACGQHLRVDWTSYRRRGHRSGLRHQTAIPRFASIQLSPAGRRPGSPPWTERSGRAPDVCGTCP